MTRKQFHDEYVLQTGDGHHNSQCWKEFRESIQQNDISWSNIRFWKAVKMQQKDYEDDMKNAWPCVTTCASYQEAELRSLASLQTATCTAVPVPTDWYTQQYYVEQEGINPMFKPASYSTGVPAGDLTINLAPAASASMSTKSDVAIQRDYLMSRLDELDGSVRYGKMRQKLRDAFFLDVNNAPRTSQALIDAIKGGKFKLDDRKAKLQAAGEGFDEDTDEYIGDVFGAIIWDGPMPDRAGFDAALETLKNQLKTAKDTIIVKSPDEGLAAIQALEAWTPTGKAN